MKSITELFDYCLESPIPFYLVQRTSTLDNKFEIDLSVDKLTDENLKALEQLPNGSVIRFLGVSDENRQVGGVGVFGKEYIYNKNNVDSETSIIKPVLVKLYINKIYFNFVDDPESTHTSDYDTIQFQCENVNHKGEVVFLNEYPTMLDIIEYLTSGFSNKKSDFILSSNFDKVQKLYPYDARHSLVDADERKRISAIPCQIEVRNTEENHDFYFENALNNRPASNTIHPFFIRENNKTHTEYTFKGVDTDLDAVIDFTLKIDFLPTSDIIRKFTIENHSINAEEFTLMIDKVSAVDINDDERFGTNPTSCNYYMVSIRFDSSIISKYYWVETVEGVDTEHELLPDEISEPVYADDGSTIVGCVINGETVTLHPVYRTTYLTNTHIYTNEVETLAKFDDGSYNILDRITWGYINDVAVTDVALNNILVRIDNSGSRVNAAPDVSNNIVSNEIIPTKGFDLYSINTPGYYFYHYNASQALTMKNTPSGISGSFVMFVYPNGIDEPVAVTIIDTAKRFYLGYRDNTSKVISWTDVLDRSNAISAKEISDNADLFHYTTPGYYFKNSNTKNLKNVPKEISTKIVTETVTDEDGYPIYIDENHEKWFYPSLRNNEDTTRNKYMTWAVVFETNHVPEDSPVYAEYKNDTSIYKSIKLKEGADVSEVDSYEVEEGDTLILLVKETDQTETDTSFTGRGFTVMILPVDNNVDKATSANRYILIDSIGCIYTGYRIVNTTVNESGAQQISGSIMWSSGVSNSSSDSGSGSVIDYEEILSIKQLIETLKNSVGNQNSNINQAKKAASAAQTKAQEAINIAQSTKYGERIFGDIKKQELGYIRTHFNMLMLCAKGSEASEIHQYKQLRDIFILCDELYNGNQGCNSMSVDLCKTIKSAGIFDKISQMSEIPGADLTQYQIHNPIMRFDGSDDTAHYFIVVDLGIPFEQFDENKPIPEFMIEIRNTTNYPIDIYYRFVKSEVLKYIMENPLNVLNGGSDMEGNLYVFTSTDDEYPADKGAVPMPNPLNLIFHKEIGTSIKPVYGGGEILYGTKFMTTLPASSNISTDVLVSAARLKIKSFSTTDVEVYGSIHKIIATDIDGNGTIDTEILDLDAIDYGGIDPNPYNQGARNISPYMMVDHNNIPTVITL